MTNLKGFFNKISNSGRIFTAEDVGEMKSGEFAANEKAIDYQMEKLGMPRRNDLANNSDVVFVHAYTKSDGTQVKAHYRSKPDNSLSNNLSFLGTAAGGAANINKSAPFRQIGTGMSFLQNINKMALNSWFNKNYPDAKNLLNIALLDPKRIATETLEYKYIEGGCAYYFNKIFNLTGNKKIPLNWSGINFKPTSSLSINLSKSQELKEQLINKFNYNTKRFDSNILDISFKKDQNLHRALGNATILEPYIDNNGYFNAILFDKYDFDIKKKYNDNSMTTFANNYFALKQKTSTTSQYYLFVPIRFKW